MSTNGTHSMALQIRTETFLCSLMKIQALLFAWRSRVNFKKDASACGARSTRPSRRKITGQSAQSGSKTTSIDNSSRGRVLVVVVVVGAAVAVAVAAAVAVAVAEVAAVAVGVGVVVAVVVAVVVVV